MFWPRFRKSNQELAALSTNGFIVIAIGAMSAAILIINRGDLSNTDRYCYRGVWRTYCQDRVLGCLWTADVSNTGPCNYCYAVGAISIFAQILSFCFSWTTGAWPVNVVVSCFNVVWFAVAGDYFTKFKDHRMLPEDGSRHAIMGLMWACLALAGVQFIMSVAMTAMWKKLRDQQHTLQQQQQQQHQQQHQQQLAAVQPPAGGYPYPYPYPYGAAPAPPPPPGYPAGAAAGGYAPPPPPGGYPYGAQPPAGYYQYAAPPGGYVYGTPVPPGGGDNAHPAGAPLPPHPSK